MTLANTSIEMLVDLVEIKMLSMEVRDCEDKRILNALTRCRSELILMARESARVKLVSLHADLEAIA